MEAVTLCCNPIGCMRLPVCTCLLAHLAACVCLPAHACLHLQLCACMPALVCLHLLACTCLCNPGVWLISPMHSQAFANILRGVWLICPHLHSQAFAQILPGVCVCVWLSCPLCIRKLSLRFCLVCG